MNTAVAKHTVENASFRTVWRDHSNKIMWGLSIGVFAAVSAMMLPDDASIRMRFDASRLMAASVPVKVHLASAMSAFLIGVILLLGVKGNTAHRVLGYGWVAAMAMTAGSSFFLFGGITEHVSLIHALSAWTLIGLPMGIAAARRRNIKAHAKHMTGMFTGGMAIAGLFTFLPGRLMWSLFFGV